MTNEERNLLNELSFLLHKRLRFNSVLVKINKEIDKTDFDKQSLLRIKHLALIKSLGELNKRISIIQNQLRE